MSPVTISFDQQMLRLKQCLGVTEDQDVAATLGMTKGALSERKRRGAFPEDKLFALKVKIPELDAYYVLTGERWGDAGSEVLMSAAGKKSGSNLAGSVSRSAVNNVEALKNALQHEPIRRLVGLALFCEDQALDALCRMAYRLGQQRLVHRGPVGPAVSPMYVDPPFSSGAVSGEQAKKPTLVKAASVSRRASQPSSKLAGAKTKKRATVT